MKIPVKNIEETFEEIAGPEGVQVYRLLKNKEDVNEFNIAEKLKITINQLRNIIYKFEKYNLLTSIRKKDRKKGWYIYFFTLNPKQIDDTVVQLVKDKMSIIEKQLDREKAHQFYLCPNRCVRQTIENAMENQFMCHECGSLLDAENNDKTINKMQKRIEELNIKLKELSK